MLEPRDQKCDVCGIEFETLGIHTCCFSCTPDGTPAVIKEHTFVIPEYRSWEIKDIGEQGDNQWDCFSEEFCRKLNHFCDKIV